MSQPSLVLLAAGMGSRYGGLKQLEGFGPSGETLMDYSIYDAARAGFGRVVFVIRRDFEAPFREQVAAKYAGRLEVALCFQTLDDMPAGRRPPAERAKPWGTGQALLAARRVLDGPFAVCNADDFYGREGYAALAEWMASAREGQAALVTYPLGATLSPHGAVSRGLCEVSGGRLLKVVEHTHLAQGDGCALDEAAAGAPRRLPLDTPASLNLFGFHPSFLPRLETAFDDFLGGLADPLKSEFQLPSEVNRGLQAGWLEARALPQGRRWFGVTYPQDKPAVQEALRGLHGEGEYPGRLF